MLKEKVFEAWILSKKYHEGQKRKYTGADYFTHPKYVARIIEDITNDESMIIVALLHDTLEDTELKEEVIKDIFGEEVLLLVKELTSEKDRKGKTKTEYLTLKMNNMSDKAFLIKLADRYHNIKYVNKDCKTREHMNFIKKYWTETKDILSGLRRNYTAEHKLMVSGIEFQLEYLKTKYKW